MESAGANPEANPLVWIQRRIRKEYGIHVPRDKLDRLETKLNRRLSRLDLENLGDYVRLLQQQPEEESRLVQVVTTNKSYFFREPAHWEFLEDKLVPHWRESRDRVRIWSCACSSGEEPYSAAMVMEDSPASIPYRILASDLCDPILRIGSRGVYSRDALESIREYDPEYVSRYFQRLGDDYRVVERIRDRVFFRRFNLQFHSNPFESRFDLILLRNVLIYFDKPMIQNVIDQCSSLLKNGGYLFIGHTEDLRSIDHSFRKVQPSVFCRGTLSEG